MAATFPTLSFNGVSVDIQDKRILWDVSGRAEKGEILAIMGPSGECVCVIECVPTCALCVRACVLVSFQDPTASDSAQTLPPRFALEGSENETTCVRVSCVCCVYVCMCVCSLFIVRSLCVMCRQCTCLY